MRIGILTFPGSPSYGASLQMFALYNILSDKGYDVEVINYKSKDVIHERIKNKSLRCRVISIISFLLLKKNKPLFKLFESQVKKYPNETVSTTAQIKELGNRYDRIIVGSDQVWNAFITGNDMNFYLEFLDDSSKKAAYAPSFGSFNADALSRPKIAELLTDFSYLSARELQGAQVIKELTGKDVPVVLDPTMLLNAEDWRKHCKNMRQPKEKYVFYYVIKPSQKLKSFAKEFAKKHNLRLVSIGGRLREYFFNREIRAISGVGPAEFLGLMDGATYVITNSFHGTAFSIILQKNFYIEYSSDTNDRLINIVETFGLQGCVVGGDALQKNAVNVDYLGVDSILKDKQKSSLDYLYSIAAE